MKEKKIFFVYSCFRLSRYIKGGKIHIMRHNWIFRHTCCINNAHWQMVELWYFYAILYSYFRYTGRLFLGCAFFVARCNIRNQEGIKIELQKKVHRRICVRDIFLAARHPFYVTFCCFLRLLPLPFQVTYLLNGPYKDT